jgi:hypothetical protein
MPGIGDQETKTGMRWALVIYEGLTSTRIEDERAWTNAIGIAKDKAGKSENVKALSDTCYVCNLRNGLYELALLIDLAARYRLRSHTLFFEKEIPFVTTSPEEQ